MASAIAKILQAQGQTEIVVGPFTGPSDVETSGPGIQKLLQEEFEKLGVQTSRRAKIKMNGKYFGKTTSRGLVLQIEALLVDSFGAVLTKINSEAIADFPIKEGKVEAVVRDEATAIAALQPTADIPADLPPAERAENIRESLNGSQKPPHLSGSEVYASSSSPYGVEVIVNGQPRSAKIDADGLAFVAIERGEEYEVVLINNSGHRAVARLMIDGLNSFAFSDVRVEEGPNQGDPLYDFWAIQPHNRSRITGWHKRDAGPDNIRAFEVSSYADSAAGSLEHTSDLGTISAIFHAAWEKGQPPPADLHEPPKVTSRGLSDATKLGRAKTQDIRPVELETGVVRAAVSIRYARGTE
ncbi:MAG: hypothetical protein KDA75_18840 [Planctomycetaceae bacterium]|nr:hypothetical protein [Planctomycetaceae bacterium]